MTQDTEAGVRVVLDGALTMRTVDAVRATLRQILETAPAETAPLETAPLETPAGETPPGAAVMIDCRAAGEVDLTFIQLLIASRVSGRHLGRSVNLAAAPDGALLDTLTRGGFRVVSESASDGTAGFWFEGTDA